MTYPAIKRDATNLEWRLKKHIYSQSKITVVTTSKWLENNAKSSILSKHFPIIRIPHGICTETYKPLDRQMCKEVLNITKNKIVLMFAAVDITDYRKGGDLLLTALNALPESLKSDIVLLIMGAGGNIHKSLNNMESIFLGYVAADNLKNICYNAADIFLFPTRADIWSLVVQEAMACGTPSIAFDVGGVSDLVRPRVTGLLASDNNALEMQDAIIEMIGDDELRATLAENCRRISMSEYDIKLQASRYIKLYEYLKINS